MARRTSSGRLDDGVELPWWVSVVFAAIIYIFLNWIFPSLAGSNVFLKNLAAAAQASAGLLALLFLVLAGLSLLLEYRRRRLLDLQVSLATIRALPRRRFEQFVAEAFHGQGYAVSERDSAAPDRGVDLVLTRGNEKVLVQCRRWRSETIDIAPVRQLYDVMVSEQASGCTLLASGAYSNDALRFAAGKPIRLIGGQALEKMLRGVKRAAGAADTAHAPESSLS
ncbi:MAG: restriction endonuclease [Betaproteobacteria bacterium]|nr:restriction endonuclease [Betaproteobacteria bacterium]